jgi:hypothetical protein
MLSLEELTKGLQDYGTGMNADEVKAIFTELDEDGSGSIAFTEFIEQLIVSGLMYKTIILEPITGLVIPTLRIYMHLTHAMYT